MVKVGSVKFFDKPDYDRIVKCRKLDDGWCAVSKAPFRVPMLGIVNVRPMNEVIFLRKDRVDFPC